MYIVPRWIFAISLYIFVVLLIFATRPSIFFTTDGKIKPLGVGLREGKSIFGLSLFLPLIAVFCYFIGISIRLALT
jgi:hypothetical protein